jgi:hypothetical protein
MFKKLKFERKLIESLPANLGNPNNYLDSGPGVPNPLFGQSTQTLVTLLGKRRPERRHQSAISNRHDPGSVRQRFAGWAPSHRH